MCVCVCVCVCMCVCVCVLYTHCKQILNYESLERLIYAISTGLWEWAIPIVTETPLVVGCKKKKDVFTFRAFKVTM